MFKDTENILTIISLFFGFWYVFFYMMSGKNSNPKTFRYNELFEKQLLKKHFLIATFFSLIGIFRFNALTLETYYFSPLIFILLVKISNPLFNKLYNRHILIATRWDSPAKGKNGIKFLDRFVGFLIAIMAICGPIMMKYDKFDEINGRHKNIERTKLK